MMQEFKNGMSVRALKELVKDWPEENSLGEENQVWLGDLEDYSNLATEFSSLNEGDILLTADVHFK